jgi:hypothetical protein
MRRAPILLNAQPGASSCILPFLSIIILSTMECGACSCIPFKSIAYKDSHP